MKQTNKSSYFCYVLFFLTRGLGSKILSHTFFSTLWRVLEVLERRREKKEKHRCSLPRFSLSA